MLLRTDASIHHFLVIIRVLPESNVIQWLELVSVSAVSKRCSTNTTVCACNKLEQVYMLGPASCKVIWLYVLLNKREWIWVGGVGRGWTKRDLIVMAVCRSNLTLSLYLSSSHSVVCVCVCIFFFELGRVGGGGEGFLCVSALCEPTLNIPARKAGSDTSYY